MLILQVLFAVSLLDLLWHMKPDFTVYQLKDSSMLPQPVPLLLLQPTVVRWSRLPWLIAQRLTPSLIMQLLIPFFVRWPNRWKFLLTEFKMNSMVGVVTPLQIFPMPQLPPQLKKQHLLPLPNLLPLMLLPLMLLPLMLLLLLLLEDSQKVMLLLILLLNLLLNQLLLQLLMILTFISSQIQLPTLMIMLLKLLY